MKRKRSASRSVWLLATVVLAILVWYWRQSGNLTPPTKAIPPNATNASAGTRTNETAQQLQPLSSAKTTPLASSVATNSPRPDLIPVEDHNTPPAAEGYPRAVRNVFELQVALARQGVSCGSIDGVLGPQTRAAIRSFQQKEHLVPSGEFDKTTKACLVLTEPPTTKYEVTSNDLARLQPLSSTWLGKSRQSALDYETVLELIAEQAQAYPGLVKQLNPAIDWTNVPPGTVIEVPNPVFSARLTHAAFVTIRLEDKILEAWDASTNLLGHFPCSIARRVEKRPVGELHVAVIVYNPNYTFDPDNFPESPEAQQLKAKLVLPPGPNNPVGIAWIGLDRPGYGIHGTPNPEQVGRTESHGCFRLANWNAERLARMVDIGTPVFVEP